MDPGVARRDDRKPSTPPIRDQQRNSRILPQQQRKPEDLDVLAAQLNELASSPRNQRGGPRANERQRVPSQVGFEMSEKAFRIKVYLHSPTDCVV
jgi:hypothetical protein